MSNKSERSKKDLQDKVKEIKQRQENWLKQRERSLKTPPKASSSNVDTKVKQEKPCFQKSSSESHSRRSSSQGFGAWLSRRGGRKSVEHDKFYASEEEDVKSTNPAFRNTPDSPLSTHSSLCSTQLEEETYHTSVKPDEFDKRADNIINRVKKELYLKDKSQKDYKEYNSNVYVEEETEKQVEYHGIINKQNRPASHFCPVCNNVMMPPCAAAMLVVPCGHTVCSSCGQTKKHCPVCSMQCNSMASNIMLQQIITDFSSYHDSKHTEKSNVENTDAKNFLEEYKNLQLRCEVLETEEDNIVQQIQELDNEKRKELLQMQAIEKEEAHIQQEIAKLHGRIQALNQHKGEYQQNHQAIEIKQNSLLKKQTMVKETIDQLQREAAKIKEFLKREEKV